MTMTKEKPECPYRADSPVAYDYEHDKVYEGAAMCSITDKWCLLEENLECEIYEEFLEEQEDDLSI